MADRLRDRQETGTKNNAEPLVNHKKAGPQRGGRSSFEVMRVAVVGRFGRPTVDFTNWELEDSIPATHFRNQEYP